MKSPTRDEGSAGDANYGVIGQRYAQYRRPDARIAAAIRDALVDARTVLNVGAGAGGYEPTDLQVTAVEPSAAMRAQRPAHLPPAIDAVAEELPFADASFDAGMATFTVHQWLNLEAGLAELRRVVRGPVVILSCDPDEVQRYWMNDYAPEVLAVEARRYPPLDVLRAGLGGESYVEPVAIPLDCSDGFCEAYYGRPERLLDPEARTSCSAFSFVGAGVVERFAATLREDLRSGRWDARHGHLRAQTHYEGSLRLIVALP